MVGLIDCDNFFCSCERVFRPDLAHTPLVVLSNNDGCVVARSREVKAMGIPEGMPYHELMQQYPHSGIVAFSSNYALYGDMSARVMSILAQDVPEVVQYSIDEAFLVLDGIKEGTLKRWGEDMCRKIQRSTGLPVSIGIGESKTLAKMASKYAKKYPGYHKCCHIATPEQRLRALSLFPVGDVWGIGLRTAASLATHKVFTAYDFASRQREWVRKQYHVTGERTWIELNGRDAVDVEAMDGGRKKTIVTSRSFPSMIREMADLRTHVANYAARCAAKLRRQGSVCSLVSVFIQSNYFREDLEQYAGGASASFLTPTSSSPELVNAALGILERIFRKGIYYKRAGVMVSALSNGASLQPDLFTYNPERAHKLDGLSTALDSINGRMGADTVVLGAQQYRQLDADGKNVRFVNAIKRAMKSPDYSTRLGAFTVG